MHVCIFVTHLAAAMVYYAPFFFFPNCSDCFSRGIDTRFSLLLKRKLALFWYSTFNFWAAEFPRQLEFCQGRFPVLWPRSSHLEAVLETRRHAGPRIKGILKEQLTGLLQITQRRTEANTLNLFRQTKAKKLFFFSKTMNTL